MEPVQWVHLVSAMLWPAVAVAAAWWMRSVVCPRHRRWLYAVIALALLIGGANLLQALVHHHLHAIAHLVANLVLAATGAAALVAICRHGRGVLADEQVLRALSGGRLAVPGRRRPVPVPLTRREIEVATYLCRGLSTNQIAQQLRISRHTAITHIRNILRKLDVGSRAEVVVWAVESGLVADGRHAVVGRNTSGKVAEIPAQRDTR